MWYASTDTLPFDMDSGEWLFVRKVLGLVREDVILGDYSSASEVLAKLRQWQVEKCGADNLPSNAVWQAEQLYNTIDRPKPAAMAALTAGILLFVLTCAGMTSSAFRSDLCRYDVSGLAQSLQQERAPRGDTDGRVFSISDPSADTPVGGLGACAHEQWIRDHDDDCMVILSIVPGPVPKTAGHTAFRHADVRFRTAGSIDWGVRSWDDFADAGTVLTSAFCPCSLYDDILFSPWAAGPQRGDGYMGRTRLFS